MRFLSAACTKFATGLRAIAADVEPGFQIRNVKPMDDVLNESHLALRLGAAGLIVVASTVLFLSAAGLYSLMSVIVTQRRREIGIRIALGADRRRVLSGSTAGSSWPQSRCSCCSSVCLRHSDPRDEDSRFCRSWC